MTRRQFSAAAAAGVVLSPAQGAQAAVGSEILPGVWRVRFGAPEAVTPVQLRRYEPASNALAQLTRTQAPVELLASITGHSSKRGFEVTLPLEPNEMVYGLGLQFQSFLQRGLKKKLRVNADPKADLGDSHAPVPFYVSSHGYGVFVDSARYVEIYCGNKVKKGTFTSELSNTNAGGAQADQLPEAYRRFHVNEPSKVLIEIPESQGIDIYLFTGPTMRLAVQRYNLFAGGGALPPRWGLGFWYRCYGQFDQAEVLEMAEELRSAKIPCDVLGLEPGWQSHSYSCSFTWSNKFPAPSAMLSKLNDSKYHVNLWEHAFTHPSSPLHKPLLPYSGDYEVWGGIVPDFTGSNARKIFSTYHEREFVAHGVSGFKLDECDNSDYTGNWSFPELSRFPSGPDGEQMHSLFGLNYQSTIQSAFERQQTRTLGLARSSHALAAPYTYALYSDTYDHKQFIRAIVNAGFCGLLWCPEVRDARDGEDLIRRLQTVILSPLAMVNAWYIKNPPWKQMDREQNNQGDFASGWKDLESACRRLIELRMQLVPYLYSAFVRYHLEGIPPFRALVMDYPDDPQTWTADDQFLIGEHLLAAPVIAGEREREVYLPAGEWFDFWTGRKSAGSQRTVVTAPLDQLPMFVRSGALLPLAQPTLSTEDPDAFGLTVRGYGNADLPCTLYEDDGSMKPAFTKVTLVWETLAATGMLQRSGPAQERSYSVKDWKRIS